jgi:hypothetical protein
MTSPSAQTIRQNILSGGIMTGFIGYVVVAAVLAALNIDTGRSPFYTAALLGSALFYHLTDPATLSITAGPIFAYNALHLLVFLGLGLLVSWLVCLAERYPAALYLILFPLLLVAAHMFLALVIFAEPLLGAAGPWHIGLGSVAGAVAMGWYTWRTHPMLQHDLRDTPLGEVPDDRL